MTKFGVFLVLSTAATLVGQHQFEVVTGKPD
jgi:hypothetical protein